MTAPAMPAPPGFAVLPGGYQNPSPLAPQPGQAPAAPTTPAVPAPLQWTPPGPPGAPIEGSAPFYPPTPGSAPQSNGAPISPSGAVAFPPHVVAVPPPQLAAGAAPAGIDPNTVLSGPNIPAELQGRTMAEAIRIYDGMRNIVLQTSAAPPQSQGLVTPPPQAPAQIPGGQTPDSWDWRNPEKAIEATVERVVQRALGPMIQQNTVSAMERARNQVAATVGPQVFAQIESAVIARLQGADSAALANPAMWQIATDATLGEMMRRGQPMPGARPPLPPGAQVVAPGAQPVPNFNGFYTEAPTGAAPTGGGNQLSPQQEWARQQMGQSVEEYIAWGGARR